NVAIGRTVSGHSYDNGGSTNFNTENLTNGDGVDTCERFNGYNIYFNIYLQTTYNIKLSRLVFKGNFSSNATYFQNYDNTYDWPFYITDSFRTEVPHTVDFDIQRTGSYIYFYIWFDYINSFEIELCEIEIIGCETDHYGEDCLPCNKSKNCEVCDVNNGACYVCSEGYTGPNCSINTENVALQSDTSLYYYEDHHFFHHSNYLPSYRLFDGYTKEPSCIDLSLWERLKYHMSIMLQNVYNIKDMQFYFINTGNATIKFNYQLQFCCSSHYPYEYSGVEDIPAFTSSVIKIIYPIQESIIYTRFSFSLNNVTETSIPSLSICEVEMYGKTLSIYKQFCILKL
ncbi:uncharacterized protein LOC134229164, partial [Saccostrea cucullata]|uniref:uncharacterized protein LOC134229164 n=1 Tax=Saccostrea cuccullata TaxID=36930 RepID=UPI002ED530BE